MAIRIGGDQAAQTAVGIDRQSLRQISVGAFLIGVRRWVAVVFMFDRLFQLISSMIGTGGCSPRMTSTCWRSCAVALRCLDATELFGHKLLWMNSAPSSIGTGVAPSRRVMPPSTRSRASITPTSKLTSCSMRRRSDSCRAAADAEHVRVQLRHGHARKR